MTAVRYHGWWPSPYDPFYVYNPSENGSRINYYRQNAVPNLHIDGLIDASSQEQHWWSAIQQRSVVGSPVEISLAGVFNGNSRTGELEIGIDVVEAINEINLRVRIALTESELFFEAPNGLNWHHQVMRDIIPYPYGIPVELEQGQFLTIDESFTCPDPLEPANCNLVVWIQSDATAEVIQAARIELDQLSPTGIEDEADRIPQKSSLRGNYPNPFNAFTTIEYELPRRQKVSLAVYDIKGRMVTLLADETADAGTYAIRFDAGDLPSGIYFYLLSTEDNETTRGMTLIK